jgi:hypothetical protein
MPLYTPVQAQAQRPARKPVAGVLGGEFVGIDVEKVRKYVSGFGRVSSSVPCNKHNPFQPGQDNPELPNCVSLQRYPHVFREFPRSVGAQ